MNLRSALALVLAGLVAALAPGCYPASAESRTIEARINNAQFYLEMARTYRDGTDILNLDRAIVEYQQALEVDPKCVEAYIGLGGCRHAKAVLYIQANQLDVAAREDQHALAAYTRARRIRPDHAEIYMGFGQVYHDRLMIPQAIESFEKARDLGKDDPGVQARVSFYMGNLLVLTQRYAEARDAYTRYLQLFPAAQNAHEVVDLMEALQKRVDQGQGIGPGEAGIRPVSSDPK